MSGLFKRKIPVVPAAVLAVGISCNAGAAEDVSPARLLTQLSETIDQLRQTEAQGQEIKDRRIKNRRDMDRVEAEGKALEKKKSEIDDMRADYAAALEEFNNQCSGKKLSANELDNCQSREAQLDRQAGTLDQRAGRLKPGVDMYNRQVATFNKQDEELAVQEEALYAQAQTYVSEINQIKTGLVAQASAAGRKSLIDDVDTCNALAGFEDTLTCMRAVWGIKR